MNRYPVDPANIAPFVSLTILYEKMPETTGCDKCESVNGKDRKAWCCKTISPSMYYVEFLAALKLTEKWSKKRKLAVVMKAIRSYLSNGVKGCIFYDDKCTIYQSRPFSCRQYGVTPQVNWDKHMETLKKRQGDKFVEQKQCDMVSTKNGEVITPEQEDKWFKHTMECEARIGVPIGNIRKHDEEDGSYRNFQDHLLLDLFSQDFLGTLTEIKRSLPSESQIDDILNKIETTIKKNHLLDDGSF